MVGLKSLEERSAPAEKGHSLLADSMQKFRGNRMALFGCGVVALLFIVSLLAAQVAPYSYADGVLEEQNLPPGWYQLFMDNEEKATLLKWAQQQEEDGGIGPDDFAMDPDADMDPVDAEQDFIERPEISGVFSGQLDHLEPAGLVLYLEGGLAEHLMGTDEIGQDIFSRVIYGMRLSLFLAITVTCVSVLIGVTYGAVSGYAGGWLDRLMMRFVDFLFGIPFIFLVILLMVFFGREIWLIFVGLGLVYWIVLARIVRGQIMSLKNREFVLAARTIGVGRAVIIFKHLVPNILGPVVVFSTLLVPQIMLLEAFLSFIGLGVSPPEVSLGVLISDGAGVISSFSWPIIYPGIVFSLMIFCMNFVGDGLRDALDPKSIG